MELFEWNYNDILTNLCVWQVFGKYTLSGNINNQSINFKRQERQDNKAGIPITPIQLSKWVLFVQLVYEWINRKWVSERDVVFSLRVRNAVHKFLVPFSEEINSMMAWWLFSWQFLLLTGEDSQSAVAQSYKQMHKCSISSGANSIYTNTIELNKCTPKYNIFVSKNKQLIADIVARCDSSQFSFWLIQYLCTYCTYIQCWRIKNYK